MLQFLPRILMLWRIVAYYRFDTLFPHKKSSLALSLAYWLIRLHPAGWFSTQHKSPMRIKLAIEQMGPLFIKLGQLLSTRRDLISPELLLPLSYLQDKVAPFDVTLAKASIESAFKQPIAALFSRFDEKPLAAASIAQIHTAALHDGREVIVKIVRPTIRAQLITDFNLLDTLVAFIDKKLPQANAIHLPTVIRDYRQTILNELDLTLEAENTRQFRHNFMGSNMMYVPEIYADSKDVLIAERITGVPVSDIATFDTLGIDRAQLAERGLTIFFTQVFRDNFFHADMHPGNVFVETLNPTNPRYISLDCAIVGQLSEQDQLCVARILLAVMQNNFPQLIHIAYQAGWISAATDQMALARDMKRTVGPMISKPIDQLDFAGILVDILDIARRYHLQIPSQLVLLLKTLVHIEGLGRDLYPQLDIWKLAKPILTAWVKDKMNPITLFSNFSNQLPDLILGVTQMPKLLLDTMHAFKLQQTQTDKQVQQLELIALLYKQQHANWITIALICMVCVLMFYLHVINIMLGFVMIALLMFWRIIRY